MVRTYSTRRLFERFELQAEGCGAPIKGDDATSLESGIGSLRCPLQHRHWLGCSHGTAAVGGSPSSQRAPSDARAVVQRPISILHAAVVSRSANTCQIASHLRQRQTTMDLRTVVFTSSEPHTGHRLTVWFGMAGEGISIEWQRQLSSVAGTCVTEDEATEVEREDDRSRR